MVSQFGFLTYKHQQLRCLRMGQGQKVLVAFHGFGQDCTVFLPLGELIQNDYTVVAIDFPAGSSTLWKSRKKPNSKTMSYFLERICADFKVQKVSLLGYSMGARPALCLTGYAPEKVEKLILLAPDGLRKNIWYYLATHSFYGNLIFRNVLKKPEKWLRYFDSLSKIGIVDQRWRKILSNSLMKEDYRKQVLNSWMFTKNFIPDPAYIRRRMAKAKIPLDLFMGKYDTVFPPEEGRLFIENMPLASFHELNCGHQILNADFLEEIAGVL